MQKSFFYFVHNKYYSNINNKNNVYVHFFLFFATKKERNEPKKEKHAVAWTAERTVQLLRCCTQLTQSHLRRLINFPPRELRIFGRALARNLEQNHASATSRIIQERYRSNTLADNAPHIYYSYSRNCVRRTFITFRIVGNPNPTFSEQSIDVVFHSLSSLFERFY